MENLKIMYSRLPELGWGEAKTFTGSPNDLENARTVLNAAAFWGVVFKRAAYKNQCREDQKPECTHEQFIANLAEAGEDTYLRYVLKNYKLCNGEFNLGVSIAELDNLAAQLIHYKL